MKLRRACAALAAVWLAGPAAARSPAPASAEIDGVSVSVVLDPPRPRQGDNVALELTLRDAASGRPLAGARPGAWLTRRLGRRAPTPRECKARVAAFLGGSLLDRPAADLNGYYVLVLNDDASIFVVDPRFSFGGSRLLALLPLAAPGADWAATPDGTTLLVSQPAAGKVAVADLVAWDVRAHVDVGPEPGALALAPGGERAWVATRDGLAVIDVRTRTRAASIALGAGPRALALDADGRRVFATAEGGVTVVDARSARRERVVALEAPPTLLAFSAAAGFAYAGDPASGRVFAVDPARDQAAAGFEAAPGFTQIRFAPGGRLGFLPNPERDVVQVFDAASNRVVRTVDVQGAPDQVTFSDHLAYVRRRRSEGVVMIPLGGLEREGATGVADFPGGEHALGAPQPALADSIVAAPEGPAVLVANAADRHVYYYREGMAAPMGGFANFSRQPRALLVVDRSLRERPDGRYVTTARLDEGLFDLVVFLDAPRLTACFEVEVVARGPARAAPTTRVELVAGAMPAAGRPARVRVRLTDLTSGRPRAGLADVEALVAEAPGVWHRRVALTDVGGFYECVLTPPAAGAYSLWVESPAAGLTLLTTPSLMLSVERAGP